MKRWLLWTLRCRRGSRCARLTMAIVDTDGPPPGSFVRLDWTCGNCGTEYTLEAMVGGSELVELWRERRV